MDGSGKISKRREVHFPQYNPKSVQYDRLGFYFGSFPPLVLYVKPAAEPTIFARRRI